jgi:hypothetical protein
MSCSQPSVRGIVGRVGVNRVAPSLRVGLFRSRSISTEIVKGSRVSPFGVDGGVVVESTLRLNIKEMIS